MPEPPTRPRVLSGIQPSGDLHLGNYLGALRNWVAEQDRYENFFCIVDLHALTVPQPPAELRRRTLDVAALYLACGLNPATCEIFIQSHVAAHAQLGWIITCSTPMGWLERMTQFKQKSQGAGRERVGTGLFVYPALMAADILLYDADLVPVGDDQRQHIELCRDVAQRINHAYGDVLKVPAPLIRDVGARIMGLDDPEMKMSKSVAVERPGHAVFMLDAPDLIRRKVMRAKTDTAPEVGDPVGAGIANLLDIYAACTGGTAATAYAEFAGKQYGSVKAAVADAVVAVLEPIQGRFAELREDEGELEALLRRSAGRASEIGDVTLARVEDAFGMVPARSRG